MNRQSTTFTTGPDFQKKKIGTCERTSTSSSGKNQNREEHELSRSRANQLIQSVVDTVFANDRLETKPHKVLETKLHKGKPQDCDKTKPLIDYKLEKRKKPNEQTGKPLKKWKAKCFKRRQQKTFSREQESKEKDHQPWERVERSKVEANQLFRFATWNVRTMRASTDINLVATDLKERKILVAGLQECRWLKEENGRKEGDYKFWGGGAWKNAAKAAQGGVAIAVHKSLWKSVERFVLVSGRTAVLTMKVQFGKRIVFCSAWCPVETSTDKEKAIFWEDFQKMTNHPDIQRKPADMLITTGDFNGELPTLDEESEKNSQTAVVGRWGPKLSQPNENGLRLHEEAQKLNLCAASSQIRKPEANRWTFLLRTAKRKRRMYDHAFIPYHDRGKVKNSRVIRDTLHESDHGMVITDLWLSHTRDKKIITKSKITSKLRSTQIADQIEDSLKTSNMFAELASMQIEEVQHNWTKFQDFVIKQAEETKNESLIEPKKPWISESTMDLIRRRAGTKKKLLELEDADPRRNQYTKELGDLRTEIRSSAKKDRKDWVEKIIEGIRKAGNTGDSKKVFESVKKLSGKRGSAPASLDGIDSDIWVKFFSNLLGKESKPEEIASERLKGKRSWRICQENLEPGKTTEPWRINLETPKEEEIVKVLKKARKGKSVSGIIPSEFWQNSSTGRKILTVFIQKVWEGATPPEEWLNAALCLLYKQKGSKTDPNSYRGISLLSSAEKIISLIILTRIKPHLDKTLNSKQSGFRTGKSCRNAVFILLRDMERSIKENKPLVYNFVDFKKAFDSLDWSTMWKVMEAQGMPKKIVAIIKQLYNNATVSVRLNSEDKMAPSFKQKVGIRQGCSLSPALFVLVLDYAMKAYMEACEQLGIEGDADWLGYADDLAVKSSNLKNSEEVFHQLQAACAFVGLHCNTNKTECMAMGICKKEIPVENASKERIQVKFENGYCQGWLIDWEGRQKLLDEEELRDIESKSKLKTHSHVIIYDEDEQGHSDKEAIDMGKNGWLTDQDGDKHRCKLLGSKEYLEENKNKFRCKVCTSVFHSGRALKSHTSKCQNRLPLTAEKQAQLRRRREANANLAGRKSLGVEHIMIKDIFDEALKPVAEFKYLGTLTTTDGWSTKEIIRRMGIAGSTITSLKRIWDSTNINLKLKSRLYSVLVMTIVLYNGECWTIKQQDLKRLEAFHFRCLKRISRMHRCPGFLHKEVDHASKHEVFKITKMTTIEAMLTEKRLRWFGHLIRESDGDPAKETLQTERRNGSKWFRLLKKDFEFKGISVEKAEVKALDRAVWRKMSKSVYEGSKFGDPIQER